MPALTVRVGVPQRELLPLATNPRVTGAVRRSARVVRLRDVCHHHALLR